MDHKTDTSGAPSKLSSMLGFQSLSGLFQQPTRGRYSKPSRSERPSVDLEPPVTTRPGNDSTPIPEPTFVPATWDRQTEGHASSPSSDAVRDVAQDRQDRPLSIKKVATNDSNPTASSSVAPRSPPESRSRVSRGLIRRHESPLSKADRLRRRDGEPRRANPFMSRGSPVKRHDTVSGDSIEPLDESSSLQGQAIRLSRDAQQTLDSMLEPGTTNVAFQDMKAIQQASSVAASDAMRPKYAEEGPTESPSARQSVNSASDEGQKKSKLTHVTSTGEAHMVDVGGKDHTKRVAIALTGVRFSNPEPLQLILENANKKGDVLSVARIAGIMASKRTADLIPLCHPIPISKVEVDVQLHAPGQAVLGHATHNQHGVITITATVECVGPTGVEMEALTAVSGAAFTVFDMCKAVDRDMAISLTKVVYKSGGRSGTHINAKWFLTDGKEVLEKKGLDTSGFEVKTNPAKNRPKPGKGPRTRWK
ncbi:hypothetical protein PRZ48_003590 [Zasmidium cellare]|uniref:cyclic pyranopterin monophosphate synthase n=1 Tax=Zasmidium cellare TaxID=395010 RepID=A0ABR0EVV5_ZASCE|nr:hypothetical protein PRZ48_003590 [Zasmidium cellare]